MKTFSTKEALKRGWHLFKAHWKLLGLSTLIMLAISSFQGIGTHDYNEVRIGGIFFAILMMIVGIIIKIGWIKMLLKIEEGHHTELKELVAHAHLFLRFVVASILCGLIVGIGFILLLIPGIYFMLKYSFVPILAIDTDLGYGALFDKSAQMTNGVKWKFLGFLIVITLVNIVGIIPFGIGLLVTLPVTFLAYLHIYRKLLHHAHPVVA
jgi:hypothetical protein